MSDDPRPTAVDLLARQAVSDCIGAEVHHYVGLRKLPKPDLDAIRARAREVGDELRPTHDEFEKSYDALRFGLGVSE